VAENLSVVFGAAFKRSDPQGEERSRLQTDTANLPQIHIYRDQYLSSL